MKIDNVLGDIIPVSIGTAMALESIMEGKVKKPNGYLFINLRTLFRNFHDSISNFNVLNINDLVEVFVDEVVMINGLSDGSLNSDINVVIYLPTYKSIPKLMPNAKHKLPSTEIQKRYSENQTHLIESALPLLNKSKNKKIVEIFDSRITGNNTNSLMISHMPLDLLSSKRFKSLRLLESHTGAVKNKSVWITKITKNAKYINIPFNILSVHLLGDANNLLKSGSRKDITALYEVSEDSNWSPATSDSKVKYDLRKRLDKAMSSYLIEMLNIDLK